MTPGRALFAQIDSQPEQVHLVVRKNLQNTLILTEYLDFRSILIFALVVMAKTLSLFTALVCVWNVRKE